MLLVALFSVVAATTANNLGQAIQNVLSAATTAMT